MSRLQTRHYRTSVLRMFALRRSSDWFPLPGYHEVEYAEAWDP
jgi:hypothetical protein